MKEPPADLNEVVWQDPEDQTPQGVPTMKQVYLDWIRRDQETMKVNKECIDMFERMARKNLDDRTKHFMSRDIVDALKQEQVELKKDIDNVRATLNPGDTSRRDGVRFRMEKDSSKDGDTRD